MKKLSLLSYKALSEYQIPSYYKLTAISQAVARLSHMKKSIKQGKKVNSPFISKPFLVSCYGFKINGMLLSIPVGNRKYINIVLNDHTVSKLKEGEPRSFTITLISLSISIRKEVNQIQLENVIGIDRNLRNVTMFDGKQSIMYKTNKLLSIKENSQFVRASFKRFDVE